MLKHQKECHQNRSIVKKSPTNRQECAFCCYSESNCLEHFQLMIKMHIENVIINQILLTNDLLLELLAIGIHKHRQCLLCMEIFETQHRFSPKIPKPTG